MAAFALQPHVADFLDVVMHDESWTTGSSRWRSGGSPARGERCKRGDRTNDRGAAARPARPGGQFLADPDPMHTPVNAGYILIAIGTTGQLTAVRQRAGAT